MRILIQVETSGDRSWQARFSAPDRPARSAWGPTRALAKSKVGEHDFPSVDAGEAGLPDPAEAHYPLCVGADPGALGELYGRITRRAPVPANKDVSVFGKYLFDTLIGRQIWAEIVHLAEEEEVDMLELALAWASDQLDLHRINWEMMHGPQNFLAAKHPERPREVAITRIVQNADWPARTIGGVPRCLFVIGAALTDRRIRPGAEYLGLLRQIERAGRAIHSRVLRGQNGLGAAPGDLRRAMVEFAPDLVQFICHGEFDEGGGARLELAADPNQPEESKLRDTGQVFQFLSEGAELPAIVVLSACNTGQAVEGDLLAGDALGEESQDAAEVEIRGVHETAPMAAQLVSKGIPVVVGMAGRVADSACRHFTRRFGEAIVRGEPLVKATAEGRRAAFAYDDQSPEESVDWAFPAVFMSAKTPAHYTPTPPAQAGHMPPVENWVASYHKKRGREPVFCGRHEFFDAYYDLFDVSKPSVLAAYVVPLSHLGAAGGVTTEQEGDRGFGKTRLLRELTAQAVRDGHIPVVVSSDTPNWEPPKTLPDLLTELFKALNETRRVYDLDKTAWQISALRDLLAGKDAELDDDVQEIYEEEAETINAQVIREALAADMTYLIRNAHAKYPFLDKAQGAAILFLDEVQVYDLGFLEGWFGGEVLGAGGLRRDDMLRRNEAEPWDPTQTILPVVMTISTAGAPNTLLKPIKERGGSLSWMRLEPLLPFPPSDDMDLMAYEHVLLNPFDERGELRREVSNRPFALNHRTDIDNWKTWSEYVREEFRGLPRYFGTSDCYRTVFIASKNDFLIPADDERRLEEYMKKDADQ